MMRGEISKAVREFEKVIRKEFREIMSKNLEDAQVDIYVEALYQGYLDACRTFEWEKKDDTERKESIKELFKVSVAKEIQEFLQGKKEFEHKNMCIKLKKDLESKNVKNMTYGKSQKIINMAFKYLYCCEHDKKMDKQFKQCHMPLDSFSLEWFKRIFKDEDFVSLEEEHKDYGKLFKKKNEGLRLKSGAVGSWSSMESEDDEEYSYEYYPYEFYSQQIKAYCDQMDINITPLELDFVVWPKMQKIMAADAFLKVYSDDSKERDEEPKKYDIGNLESTCKERVERIRGIVNNYESDINKNS